MELLTYTCGPLQNQTYLLIDEQTAVMFDAPMESFHFISKILDEKGLTLKAIILTHTHFDHILDLSKFEKKYNTKIYVHPNDEYRLKNPNEHIPAGLPLKIESVQSTEHLHSHQILEINNMRFKISHTRSHRR